MDEWRVTGRLYTVIYIFEGVPPFCELLYTQRIQDPLSHMGPSHLFSSVDVFV
jgi:hypothetical protein